MHSCFHLFFHYLFLFIFQDEVWSLRITGEGLLISGECTRTFYRHVLTLIKFRFFLLRFFLFSFFIFLPIKLFHHFPFFIFYFFPFHISLCTQGLWMELLECGDKKQLMLTVMLFRALIVKIICPHPLLLHPLSLITLTTVLHEEAVAVVI